MFGSQVVCEKRVSNDKPLAMTPFVSVIIPTFGRSETFGRTLKSLERQTYKNFEVIVVDDNGKLSPFSEEIRRVIRSFNRLNIRYFVNEVNSGAPFSRNVGLTKATGSVIAFLDDDDEWHDNKLEKQLLLFDSLDSKYGFIGCYWEVVRKESTVRIEMPKYRGNIFPRLALNYVGPTSAILFRAEVLKRVGGFDVGLSARQDIDLYYRIAKEYWFEFVPEVLMKYHHHPDMMSRNFKKRLDALLDFEKKHDDLRLYGKRYSEFKERLGELYALNGMTRQAVQCFFGALTRRPFAIPIYGKLFLALVRGKKV